MKTTKKFLALVLAIALGFTCFPTNVFAVNTQGVVNTYTTEIAMWDGTTTQPTKRETIDGVEYYKIYTPEELAYIAQAGGDWLTYNYILANDIVLNDVELTYDANGTLTVDATTLNQWTPINGFRGIFNGNNFTVSGVYVNTTSSAGFFANCRGDVSNLTITNSYIKGGSQVGGICGSFNETGKDMTNCYFDGAVVGTSSVGGLIGSNNTTNISNCGNYGDVWGTGDYVCGIVGSFYAYGIDNCFNEGNIYSTGNYVAGIAGCSDTYDISGCINKGNITGNKYVAGICGYIKNASINNSGNFGTISGTDYVGGVCGYSVYGYVESWKSTISRAYNIGAVAGESYVGGITGYAHYADVYSSYNVGNVTGTSTTGAVIGHSESIWGKGVVSGCYYYKDSVTNATLTGFGNAPDTEGVVRSKKAGYFPILSDPNADPSYSNLGYKNGETDDPIEDGSSEVQPPAAETVWDGTTLQPSVMVSVDGIYYYKIYTGKELAYIAQTGGDWLSYNYILANDIVLNDVELTYDTSGNLTVEATALNQWKPINGFRGVFNGNNFSVSGVYVNTTSSAGFFANCRGDVSNLTITNSYIKGGSQVGGICGSFNETGKDMTNCYFVGAVVGTSRVGGLIGSNNTTNISNCGNYGDVWGTGDYVCGIVGSFYAYGIDNCFNEGNIYSTGNYVAGIAGTTDIYGIGNCINKGNVTGNDYVAGVCAYVSDANISGGNFGNITGRNYVGGLVGYNARDTYNSYVSGYNIGAVSGTNCVGGIIGYATCCNISNAYSVGNVSGRTKVGAIAGYSDTVWGKGTASNCYYFKDSLTNAHLTGFGNAPDAEGVVRSKKAGYFPILSDANADPSYSNLGYKNGEVDDPIEDGSSEVQPPAAETVWDGTTLQPSVMVSIDGIYYYKIYTGKELAYIAQNGGDWLTYNYILANNIVLNNVALTYDANGNLTVDATTLNKWMPINGFTGVFNGGGFSISGVYVNTTSSAGFFTSFNGDLYNLSIVNSYIKGQSNVGGMFSSVSKVGGKIEYAYFDGAVVGNSSVGGLIGSANCTYARNCGNYGDVWGTGGYVAGLSGSFSSYGIYDCFNDGNVYSTGDYVSGITGSTSNYTISNCINRGNITGKNYVSGIVSGTRYSHVTSCGNTGNITGEKYVGGICAYNGEYLYTTSIGSCYNSGTVTGSDHVGGIIGYLSTVSLSKCYNIGNVIGTTNVGAVAGYSDSIWGRGTVSNCCYLKNQTINTGLDGFGNADDTVGIVEAKEVGFFCVNTDRTMNMNGHAYDPENACDKDCNNCGSERVVQHLFNIITYPVEPTCSTTGEKHKTCSICGEVEIEITPARGHYVSIPGKEMVDSYTLSNDSEFPFALNDGWYASTNKSHSSTSIFQIRATYSCTLVLNYKVSSERNYDKLILLKNSSTLDTISGNISEKTCTIVLTAGDVLSIKYTKDSSASDGDDSGYFKILSCTQTEIDTTVYVSTETINPTCENDVVCESCHQIMKEALGHDRVHHEGKAPTCTEKGWEAYDTCTRCDYTTYEEIAATGHHYTDTVTAPTCTEKGYTTHTCTRCDDSYVDTYVEALGHDFGEWTETKAATCTEKGAERQGCSRCEHYETREVEALGHDYKATVTDPTCTEQGYTTHTCSRCTDSYVDTYVEALGHDLGAWTETKAATCTEKGEERRDCSRCEYYETREIEVLGHDYKDTVTAPTCTEQGYTTHTCTHCEDSYVDTYVEALGHDFGEWTETKAATCTEKGEERRDCSRCEHYETREVEALGHDYKATVTDPTCTEQGYTTHTCSRCEDSYVDTYVDALGHDLGEWTETKAATCTEKGEERRDCSRCEYYETREVEALGHDYKDTVTDPTCTEQGYTTHTCSRCDDSYVDTYVEALGHDLGKWTETKAATCTEKGEERRDCSRCEHYETREIEVLGHDYKATVTDPTCTEQGYTTHTCARCGDSYVDTYVDALGHAWDDGVITKQPTATENGVKTFTCTRCGATRTEPIPATGDEPCDGGEDCPSGKFVDVNTKAWYHLYVDYAVKNGLFGGTSENTFEPEAAMTRAMLVTVLWRYEGKPMGCQNTFVDVNAKSGSWYIDAVAWAAANNIVGGIGNGKFDPEGKITREQMATILFRYANWKGIDTSKRGDLSNFPDADKVSGYATSAMQWAVAEGLINGSDGKLLPQGNATRAQVATILVRFIENIV